MMRQPMPVRPRRRLFAGLAVAAAALAAPVAANERVGNFGPVTDGALPFTMTFTEIADPPGTLPALHSFELAARPDGTWLLLGGRGGPASEIERDKPAPSGSGDDTIPQSGLHGFNPPAPGAPNNFPVRSFNNRLWVYNPLTGESLSYDLDQLPPEIANPLQTTSMQAWYDRSSDAMTVVGGYGWNGDKSNLVTYDTMIRFPVGPLVDAIRRGDPPDSVAKLFSVARDPGLQVTGGDLVKWGDDYLLLFGQNFNGMYFAFGAGLPSGTTQEYTDEIRQISMAPDGSILGVAPFAHDPNGEYHRRDLNVRMTRDAVSGAPRVGVYGGVFKDGGPAGFQHPILVDPDARTGVVQTDASQLFNGYATAVVPVWAESAQVMAQVFFGGIGRGVYHTSPEPVGMDNDGMPFGMDISVLTQNGEGAWHEFVLPEPIPGSLLLGANGQFVPHPKARIDQLVTDDGLVLLDKLPPDEDTLVGWIYGGIEAAMPQPPKKPSEGEEAPTWASDRLFEVRVRPSPGAAVPVLP